MENCPDLCGWKLLVVIVDFGQGSKVLRHARQRGVSGGTILIGEGSAGYFHDWMDLEETRKEIIFMTAGEETADQAIDHLNIEMKLHKPNHGIAFLVSVKHLLGTHHCNPSTSKNPQGGKPAMYQAIIVVVDKGMAETVVEAAESGGAHCATVMNARGSGVYETSRLFNMDIEPEKEFVLILAKTENCETVTDAVRASAKLDDPGAGIMFVLDIQKAYGLLERPQNKG